MAIEKEQGAQGLVLGGGRDMIDNRQMREEGFDFGDAQTLVRKRM